MTIFRREFVTFTRGAIYPIYFPLSLILVGIWYFIALQSFNVDNLDISVLFKFYIFFFLLFIPLILNSSWSKDKSQGLFQLYKVTKFPITKVIREKYIFYLIVFCISFLINLPLVIVLNLLGYIDFGQLFVIFLTLTIYVYLLLSVVSLVSFLVNQSVLSITLSILVSFVILVKVDMFFDFFNGLLVIGDTIFIVGIATLLNFITLFLICNRLYVKSIVTTTLILIISLFITFRFDCTLTGIYSLSSYTIDALNFNGDSVEVDYYYNKKFSEDDNFKEILYKFRSLDKLESVKVNIIDEDSVNFIPGINKYHPGTILGEELLSFITIKYQEQIQVISALARSESIEFDILRSIKLIEQGSFKRVGIFLGNIDYKEDSFKILSAFLGNHFDVEFIKIGEEIPHGLDSLIILDQFDLEEKDVLDIGHFLSEGGSMIFAGTGLPTSENLVRRDTPFIDALKDLGAYIEPFLVGDINNLSITTEKGSIKPYPLNVITRPNRSLKNNIIISPFSGFVGVYISPILINNNNLRELLFSSSGSWLVDSATGIDGVPESSYPLAVFGNGVFSNSFGVPSNVSNNIIIIGSSVSFTDYLYSLGIDSSYEFLIKSLYFIQGDGDLISSLYRNSEHTHYKIEDSLYKKSILNFVYIFFTFIYPVIILLICLKLRNRINYF